MLKRSVPYHISPTGAMRQREGRVRRDSAGFGARCAQRRVRLQGFRVPQQGVRGPAPGDVRGCPPRQLQVRPDGARTNPEPPDLGRAPRTRKGPHLSMARTRPSEFAPPPEKPL